jgi:fatty acid desaturase
VIQRTASARAALPAGDAEAGATFLRQVRALVGDLMTADPVRYSIDFIATSVVAYAAFYVYVTAAAWGVVQAVAFVVCGLAMYRAVVFTHEVVHGRARWFGRFEVLWNVLCGIPLLLPSFFYGDHKGHHARNRYSTSSDPEYLLHGSASRVRIGVFLALPLLYPLLPPLRFLVVLPLAIVFSAVDRFVWRYGSSLYNMNEAYVREYDAQARSRARWLQEAACCAWAWTVFVLVATGHVPFSVIGKAYLVLVFWMFLNQLRTIATHRYTNHDGSPITHVQQLRDTYTFDRGLLLPHLWAPVGLRYHALHHLLPALPYHAMAQAHRRLLHELPPTSPYHDTRVGSICAALRQTLRSRRSAALATPAAAAGSRSRSEARPS